MGLRLKLYMGTILTHLGSLLRGLLGKPFMITGRSSKGNKKILTVLPTAPRIYLILLA